MKNLFFVAIGGAFGSLLRYLLSITLTAVQLPFFPTLAANIGGCLFIGLFSGIFLRFPNLPAELRLLLVTGFCGGFTTFSTFASEHLQLIRNGEYSRVALYMGLTLVLGLLACSGGLFIATKAKFRRAKAYLPTRDEM